MDVDPHTPLGPTHKQTSLIDRIPQQVVRVAYKRLARNVHHNDDDDSIRTSLDAVWITVHNALKQDPHLRERLASKVEYEANIEKVGEKEFTDFLRELAKKEETDSWKELLEHHVFLKPNQADPMQLDLHDRPELVNATVQAWNFEFKGNAADVLLTTISDYLNSDRDVYARIAPIVNSSGTGKSRMVDDLSKEIITVPMCLREHGSGGFPPPDAIIRDWLLTDANSRSQDSSAQRLHAFVYSLLRVTLKCLKSIAKRGGISKHGKERQRVLASAFRDLMTKGQSSGSPGTDRVEFYNEVITKANRFVKKSKGAHKDVQEDMPSTPPYVAGGKGVIEAGEALCKFVDPSGVLDAREGPRRPLIIISFDESHKLTDEPRDRTWTLFSQLRHVLCGIVDLPIFALFLSTTESFHRFSPISPEILSHPSSRISYAYLLALHPISEISFDDVVLPSMEGVKLNQVVQMDWISHLGRPLFGTHYDALPADIKDDEVVSFARRKLLNGQNSLSDDKDREAGILACLSVRFGLEFKTDIAKSRDVARTQVERHMRLCLAATNGFQHLVTISGSEPLLAEAADQIMREIPGHPVVHLANHSDLNCIDCGRHGELIAALIIMQARDEAALAAKRRWITVREFMEALLPTAVHGELQQSLPTIWREGENKEIHETFKNYGMWFNHIIKVEDGEMISANHLWKFIERGAMVVCKDNHYGINIVLPACDVNQKLSPDTVTAILVQVKSDKRFKDEIQPGLFNAMNPFTVGLFDNKQLPHPIIRVVFALASLTPTVLIPAPPTCKNHFNHFTAFDVWCAGLSKDTFRHISEDLTSYKILLDCLPKHLNAFNLEEINDLPPLAKETKTKRAYQRQRMAALVTSLGGPLAKTKRRYQTRKMAALVMSTAGVTKTKRAQTKRAQTKRSYWKKARTSKPA